MTDNGTDDLSRSGGGGSKVDQVRQGATHAAHDVRDEVTGTVSDAKGEASQQLGHVKDEVVSHAHDLVSQTRDQVTEQADQGTQQLAGTLVSAGRELTAMADRSEQDGPMTTLVRQVGERASTMGQRFQDGGYRALKEDLTGYARSSPGVFLLAAASAGFAVGRILRNADTRAIADAARHAGDGAGDGVSAGGSTTGSPTGDQQPASTMAATAAIPEAPDLREPPGVGPDELTGLVAGGAAPAGSEPTAAPGGEVR